MSRISTLLISAALFAAAAQADRPSWTELQLDGYVDAGAHEHNQVWFTFYRVDQRFVIDCSKAPDCDRVMKVLVEANEKNKSVTVHYDPETASIEIGAPKPTYVARSVVYDGVSIEGDTKTPPRSLDGRPSWERAEFALGRGIAYAASLNNEVALPLLDEALQSAKLRSSLEVLALKARSDVNDSTAIGRWPVGEERDRFLIAALADARAWQQESPDDVEAAEQVAWVLSELGGYADALDVYNANLKRWPTNNWKTLRRIAALYRDTGYLDRALVELDKLGALPGLMDTMPYRYHRGWTLRLMGRYDEAIVEFTAGFKVQPDYFGAFMQRGCSYAAVGRLQKALDDFHAAIKARSASANGVAPSPGDVFDSQRLQTVEKMLADTLKKAPTQKLTGLCDGYWNWGDEKRERSKLLPAKP